MSDFFISIGNVLSGIINIFSNITTYLFSNIFFILAFSIFLLSTIIFIISDLFKKGRGKINTRQYKRTSKFNNNDIISVIESIEDKYSKKHALELLEFANEYPSMREVYFSDIRKIKENEKSLNKTKKYDSYNDNDMAF